MSIELKVPSAGESITEVTIVEWVKKEGSTVARDETIALIETDKANVEVVAPAAGTVVRIVKGEGSVVRVGEVIGFMESGQAAKASTQAPAAPPAKADARPEQKSIPPRAGVPVPPTNYPSPPDAVSPAFVPPATFVDVTSRPSVPPPPRPAQATQTPAANGTHESAAVRPGYETPTVRRARRSGQLSADSGGHEPAEAPEVVDSRREELVPMTPLRKRIAERLLEAQRNAALLTTFNEVNMAPVIQLRKDEQDAFTARHGVKLGFMSFFVKASIEALKAFPAINAEIRGDQIAYRHYYDVGVAVGGGRGLIVPILRNAERMSFAEIEKQIADYAARAKANRIKVEELQGGTFTISNGGIYGSLLSTPIVSPPQSGILGMHAITERPVVQNGQIVIGQVMNLALTYDHRLVDGREAVSFLIKIKQSLEKPARMLLEI